LLLLAAVFCGITVWAQRGAIFSDTKLPVPWRFGNAFCSYAIYIKQMLFPAELALLYPHQTTGLPLWKIGISIALLAGISWGVFAGRKKYPYLTTGWLWYLGMLVPVIGIMQAGLQAHADRYTYLPQIGLVIMAVWLAADWCAALRYRREVLSATAAVLLAILAIAAHRQTRHWRNTFSLWTHTLSCTDGNYLVHNTLGCLLAEKGQFEKAIPYFEQALEISPNFDVTYFNLGVTFCLQGQFDKAIPYFEKALEINPNNAVMHCTLGDVFAKRGQFGKALLHFEKSLGINPNYAEAQNNLARILATCPDATLRDGKRAVELARSADRLSGGTRAPILNTLAAAYAEAGQYPEAVATAQRALDLAAGQESAAEGIRMRLRLYEAGVPYHESRGEP
jgi:tetratricopeptide (TPR) repeat protein